KLAFLLLGITPLIACGFSMKFYCIDSLKLSVNL
ncbi:uncharacterized protein METZ01_LOCUS457824, partial [marine metagenome]